MSKHTPGPWKYEQATKTIRADPANYWLASMNSWDKAVNHDANARLIAAAPELLAALQGAAGYLKALPESHRPDQAWFKPLDKAIRKVTS